MQLYKRQDEVRARSEELLASWKVISNNRRRGAPESMEILRGHGITRVPAVIVGDRAVHGWNPTAVAGLVAATYDDGLALPLTN